MMKTHAKVIHSIFVGLLLIVSGCFDSGPPMGRVAGGVSLNGKKITEGVISFSALDGSSKTVSAFILDGQYDTMVPVGNQRVEISCVVVPPLKPGQNPETLSGRETIPSKYNTSSELRLEVSKKMDRVDYELSSK